MEKTITIDGKDVRFKSTAATALRYKAQFGKDFFSEIIKLNKLEKLKLNSKKPNYEALEQIDFDVFYNLIWALAKTADKSIPDPISWFDTFEEFPIMDIIPEVQDLLLHTIQGKKK